MVPDWCVASEWNFIELRAQPVRRHSRGNMVEPCNQLFETTGFNSDVDTVLAVICNAPWPTVSAKANRVAANLDRDFSDVFDVSFLLEELVLAFGGHQDKEPVPAEIADVGLPSFLSPPTCVLGVVAVVFLNQLLVYCLPVFARRDSSADIEPVAATYQSCRKVMNKMVSASCY